MPYLLEQHHYRPYYRKGDLEDETVIVQTITFKTRKEAKLYLENKLPRKAKCEWHKGDKPSICWYYTGKTWIHENTGETCEECITWFMKKIG